MSLLLASGWEIVEHSFLENWEWTPRHGFCPELRRTEGSCENIA